MMRKFFAALAAAITVLSGLVSCGKEDPQKETAAAASVEGIYTDKVTVTVMGTVFEYEDQSLVLTATDESTLTLSVPALGEGAMKIDRIDIEGLKISGEDGVCSIPQTDFNSEGKNVPRAYSGTVAANFNKGRMKLSISLQFGVMPIPMVISFEAQKQ